MNKQLVLVVCLAVYAIGLFRSVVNFVPSGSWWVAPLVGWLCSPVLLFALRYTLERGKPNGIFSPKTQSWAFLFGDWVFLPVALLVLGWGAWRWYDESGIGFVCYDSYAWQTLCIMIGVVAGVVFNAMDRTAYQRAGALGAVFSPSKLAHDFVSYPVFVASLLFLAGPLLGSLHNTWPVLLAALLGVALWGCMGWYDATHPPRPYDLHPAWDTTLFEPKLVLPDYMREP